jgi:ABC-type antimicrobial peptide transport system permease subunit
VSSFLPALKYQDSFYVSEGANGRAGIFKDDFSRSNVFSTSYPLLDSMAFENVFLPQSSSSPDAFGTALALDFQGEKRYLNPKIKSADGLFYGIYASDLNSVVRQLKKAGVEYRTYKDISKSVYSALITERVMFFLILMFLLIILAILICRLFMRFIAQDKRNAAILMVLGMGRKSAFEVFAAPCVALTFASLLLGTVAGCIFVSNSRIRDAVLSSLFKSMSGMSFRISYPFAAFFVFVSAALVVVMHGVLVAKMKKTDVIGIIKSNGE